MFAGFDKRPTDGSVTKGSLPTSNGIGPDYKSLPTAGLLRNPTVKSIVPEVQINPTASVPIFVRPFTQEFQTKYTEGDLLFVKRDEASSKNGYHIVANLAVLNYLLRTEKNKDGSRRYDSLASATFGDNNDQGRWQFFGIMRNDMDTSSDASRLQRLLNVDVRGRARVARFWKPSAGNIRRGDTLWIRFEEVVYTEAKMVMNPNSVPEVHQAGTYVQAFAVTDPYDAKGNSYSFPVGVVSQCTMKLPSSSSISKAHNEFTASNQLERIEVLMRI